MRTLVNDLLADAAARNPEGPAVRDRGREISYAELDQRSAQLANLLVEIGVGVGDRVAVYLEKSLEAVVAIHGILRAGACYVPFDPAAPVARLGYLASDAGASVVVTAAERAPTWAALRAAAPGIDTFVSMTEPGSHVTAGDAVVIAPRSIDARSDVPPRVSVIDQDLAYILYTSGSTGVPKGVMLTHANALAFVEWAVEEFGVTSADRLSSHAPLHFDLSTFDLFGAARAAAPVVLVPAEASVFPRETARFIEAEAITVWYSVPSALSMLVTRGAIERGALPSLRTVLFAGEVFPTRYLRALMGLLPHAEFANLYGPTETNVCTFYRVPPLPPEMTETIPIGRAIANVDVAVLAEDGRPVAPGEPGELIVRGRTVMRGYWNDPERTARSRVPDPRGGLGDPVYRTGDIVFRDADGELRYVGRRDNQIKSRGYRIELGDIEAAMFAHPGVEDVAVVAVPDEVISNRLHAYVVRRAPLDVADLVRHCRARLPIYMVPEHVTFCDALPRTSNGKVDRRSLTDAAAG